MRDGMRDGRREEGVGGGGGGGKSDADLVFCTNVTVGKSEHFYRTA